MSAIVLAMIVAPAVWRRAVFLTRKRIENAVPLTVSELQADKDRLRAEHAIAQRKLDMALKKQRDVTSDQAGEISALKQSLIEAQNTLKARDQALEQERREVEQLLTNLAESQGELAETKLEYGTTQATLVARTAEHEGVSRLRGEAETQLKKARSDLERRTSAMAKLEAQLGQARQAMRAQEEKARNSGAEALQTAELLKRETERADRLASRLAELENVKGALTVETRNRDKQIARLRQTRAGSEAEYDELEQRARDAEAERAAAEEELADMTLRINLLTKLMDGRQPEVVLEGLHARVAQLTTDADAERERADAAEAKLAQTADGETQLREEIAELAAQVVHMAAMLEGEDSPIPEIVSQENEGEDGSERISLAARVRALQAEAMAESAGKS